MNNFIKLLLLVLLSVMATSVFAQSEAKAPVQPLPLTGWDFSTNPQIANVNKEAGRITFLVEIDSVGAVLSTKIIKSEVSDELAEKCDAAIRKISFVKNANNTVGTATTKGTITFVFTVH